MPLHIHCAKLNFVGAFYRGIENRSVSALRTRLPALVLAVLFLTVPPSLAKNSIWTKNPEAKQHWDRANAAMQAHNPAMAAEEWGMAAQADPKFAEAFYFRGLYLMLQSSPTDQHGTTAAAAARAFQMYLKLKPSGTLAPESMAMLKELGAPLKSTEAIPKPKPSEIREQPQSPERKPFAETAETAKKASHSPSANRHESPASVHRTSFPLIADRRPGSSARSGAASKRNAPQIAAQPSSDLRKQCLRYEVIHGGQCRTPDEVQIRAWNTCPQPQALQVCAQTPTGSWICAIDLHAHQRKTFTGVDGALEDLCHSSGRTRALSQPSVPGLPTFDPLPGDSP